MNHGLNVDAGIFVSYIGLFSYYNFDNWTYQPSYVSSNTPWFFNGLRIQWFPTNKLKIEPWIINGWQSYAKYNGHKGLGGQILYRPNEWLSLVFNNYGNGTDDLGIPGRSRIHTDDSIEVRYFNKPDEDKGISKMAFSFTGDAGLRIRRRRDLPRWQGWAEAGVPGVDALQPDLVAQGQVCHHAWRRPDEQPGPLSDAAAAHQWSRCRLRFALLHGESRRQGPHVGYHGHLPLDAQTVHHLVGGGRLSPLGCPLLVGARRNYASRRKYRFASQICLRRAAARPGRTTSRRRTRLAAAPAASGSRIFAIASSPSAPA